MDEPRFVVRLVTGFEIRPESSAKTGNKSGREPPTSYYVLDRLNGWGVVASFDASVSPWLQKGSERRRIAAEARAAELNELAAAPPSARACRVA